MNTIDWAKMGLKGNPFNIIPDKQSNELVWAGFNTNKTKLLNIISKGLTNKDSQLVLYLSRYGGGKTHSAFYFSNNNNLPKIKDKIIAPLHIIYNTPKEGNNAPIEFYHKFIQNVKISLIRKVINTVINENGKENSLNLLSEWAISEDIGRILWFLGDDDEDISFPAEQALFGNNSVSLLNKLKLHKGITSNSDRSSVISTILHILSNYNENSKLERKRRIFFWLDELESLVFYTSKQYRPFTQLVREILDSTPYSLTFFMNFSFAEPDDIDDVEIVIGEALLDRVSDSYIFEEATDEEAFNYIVELLGYYRLEDFDKDMFYPFTEKAIKKLIEIAPFQSNRPLMPRTLNKWMLKTISEAFKQGLFQSDLFSEINENLIEQIDYKVY